MFNLLKPVSRKERIIVAAIVGPVSAIVFALLYNFINDVFRDLMRFQLELSIVYIFIGIAIGKVIQKYGRGVGKEFAIIGAISGVIFILMVDIFPIMHLFGNYSLKSFFLAFKLYYLSELQYLLKSFDFTLLFRILLSWLFRFFTIYYASRNSEVGFDGRFM